MKNVFDKAEELGKAILESEEFAAMNMAEQAAMADEATLTAAEKAGEARQRVEGLLQTPGADKDALEAAGKELEEAESTLHQLPLIKDLDEKRNRFTFMMNEMNNIIQYTLTGEEPQSGCSGSCSSCSGCN